jgi:hypothetical protein
MDRGVVPPERFSAVVNGFLGLEFVMDGAGEWSASEWICVFMYTIAQPGRQPKFLRKRVNSWWPAASGSWLEVGGWDGVGPA